jgi:hypothetical protein
MTAIAIETEGHDAQRHGAKHESAGLKGIAQKEAS